MYNRTRTCWRNMLSRCYNQNDISYKNYGGRGITVCDSWRNSFDSFFKDMGTMRFGMSIDRIDLNGNYSKENCRWIKKEHQMKNTRRTIHITINGETMCMRDWERKHNLSRHTILHRLRKGITGEALLIPAHPGMKVKGITI